MLKKLTVTVASCNECPFFISHTLSHKKGVCKYGAPDVKEMYDTPIINSTMLPDWCPLENVSNDDKTTSFGIIYPK